MTGIQWTDETWNPVTGCSRVSEGCRHCYIERTPPFRMQGRKLGDPVQLHHNRLDQPLHWKKPRRVFVNSLSDLFHEDVPDDFIDDVFYVMGKTGWRNGLQAGHIYQILTKRPARMLRYLQESCTSKPAWIDYCSIVNRFLHNVHLGVSIENQQTADERIPILLQTPAAMRFVSAEPMLSVIDLSVYLACRGCGTRTRNNLPDGARDCCPEGTNALDWVIVGGESGPQARSCDVAWIRSIVRHCRAAEVPCFVKQLGGYVTDRNDAGFDGDEPTSWPMDTDVDDPSNEWDWQGAQVHLRLRDRKGGDPAEWPEDLRVREFPGV